KGDQPTLNRVHRYERIFWTKKGTMRDKILFQVGYGFLQERSKLSIITMAHAGGVASEKKIKPEKPVKVDWETSLKEAERAGARATDGNPYYVKNGYYFRHLKPHLKDKKDYNAEGSYTHSPEYRDLKCFLSVCKEQNIKPLLISIPVNGWWYDYVGFPKENRQQYYENIRRIAHDYGVDLADFSGNEYTKYFLEDTIHLGWKGWVLVNESIYNFTKEIQ
ncbi:MAG: D-alanyl-lipoteichoic acid biosynthesis protein DltD, partial [Anaerovorax sp.]